MKYAKSKEFHRALRKVWDAELKPHEFKRCKGSVASYYRPREDGKGFIRFWAQASQWGDSWSGNSFTLNVDVYIDDPHTGFGGSDRFLGYLSAAELAEAEKITELIFSRKPKPPLDHWIYNEMSEGTENSQFWKDAFARHFTYIKGKLRPGIDIWLEYFSAEDVTLWAEFLIEPIQSILVRFEQANKRLGEPLG